MPTLCLSCRAGLRAEPQLPSFTNRPVPTIATTQIAPTKRVIRSRFFSARADPERLDCIPPPNREERPPPRPLCRRMSSTSNTLVTIKTISRASFMPSSSDGYLRAPGRNPGPGARSISVPVRRSGQRATRGDCTQPGELVGVQARATDQCAVHIGLRDQLTDVAGLHRTAVQHAHRV